MDVFSAVLDMVGFRHRSSRFSPRADVLGGGREEIREFDLQDPFWIGIIFFQEERASVILLACFFTARGVLLFGCDRADFMENVCVTETFAEMEDLL